MNFFLHHLKLFKQFHWKQKIRTVQKLNDAKILPRWYVHILAHFGKEKTDEKMPI